ncbi:DUF5995 family protein [Marinoscillum pacificum]|uniref:DUF5995 family protein n=1 Tax=Marinoscillum pacificum TaxID=392723 RepID=UPI002157AF56|nr:DUF5995 family protein [Marinoscillum pacificum]
MCETIDEVLSKLDEIIAESIAKQNPLGYFPALYRKVTQSVKDHIAEGYFDDNERMERLDVIFANRYLDAYEEFAQHGTCTQSWKLAFEGGKNEKLIVLQHLFLGMNAHINLDLGIAAAEVCPGDKIESLRGDFFKINIVLGSLVNQVQDELSEIWPFMKVIDWLSGNLDEALSDFSMNIARDGAWKVATDLAPLSEMQRQSYIEQLDTRVVGFGSGISNTGFILSVIVMFIRWGQSKDIAKNIEILNRKSELVRQELKE